MLSFFPLCVFAQGELGREPGRDLLRRGDGAEGRQLQRERMREFRREMRRFQSDEGGRLHRGGSVNEDERSRNLRRLSPEDRRRLRQELREANRP